MFSFGSIRYYTGLIFYVLYSASRPMYTYMFTPFLAVSEILIVEYSVLPSPCNLYKK